MRIQTTVFFLPKSRRTIRRKRRGLTFLLEGEVLCEVATLVVPTQQEQGGRVTQLQGPQVQHALKEQVSSATGTEWSGNTASGPTSTARTERTSVVDPK